jgi:hypothetical protein
MEVEDLRAAAAIPLLSQQVVAIAIDNINSKSDSAVPCRTTSCTITPTQFTPRFLDARCAQKLLAESARRKFPRASLAGILLRCRWRERAGGFNAEPRM